MIVSPHDVADAVRVQLLGAVEAGGNEITTSYVGAGLIAFDDCCGLLVVAPERVYRTSTFPDESPPQRTAWGDECFAGFIAINMLALLTRCVPVIDSSGNPPSEAELQAAHRRFLDDAARVWDSVSGGLPNGWHLANLDQQFTGGAADCVAAETRFTVGIDLDEFD